MSTLAAIPAGTSISLGDYLRTAYRPDREFVDGVLRERNVGKWEHARLQWLLAGWLMNHELAWGIIGSTEQRLRVSPTRIRVPDLIVLPPGPQPDVLVEPPLLIIEILSPDDTYTDTQERAQEYRHMGVPTVWIIDPKTRTGRMCSGDEWIAATHLLVPSSPVYVDLEELFRKLDSSNSANRSNG